MPKYLVKPSKDIREEREGDKWLIRNTISLSAFRLDLNANGDWNCILLYRLTMITFIPQWIFFDWKRKTKAVQCKITRASSRI